MSIFKKSGSNLEEVIRGSHPSLRIKEKRKKERKIREHVCMERRGCFPGTDDVTKHSVNETCGTFSNLAKNLHCHLSHVYTYE